MKMLTTALLFLVLSGLVPATAASQESAGFDEDPLFAALFPPELIMQHRRAIGLTDDQRDAISRMIQDLQRRVVQLQWDLQDELQQLTRALDEPRVDLDLAMDRMNAVLDTERHIKEAHLDMLVRIKNLLTVEQQTKLRALEKGPGAD